MSYIPVRRGYVALFRNESVFNNFHVNYKELSGKKKGDKVQLYRTTGTDSISPGLFAVKFQCGIFQDSRFDKIFITQSGSMTVNIFADGTAYGKVQSIKEENSYLII